MDRPQPMTEQPVAAEPVADRHPVRVSRWTADTHRRKATRRGRGGPAYRRGTLTWCGDRDGIVRTDDGHTLDVIIPNGLWPPAGARVALTKYPDGWVVAGLYRHSQARYR